MISVIKNIFIIFLVISFSTVSFAKEVITWKDEKGYFFTEKEGDLILEDLTELKVIREEKLPKLNEKVGLQKIEIEDLKLDIEVTEKINKKLDEALENSEELRIKQVKSLSDELSKEDKWYKNRSFIFISGFLVGAVLVVVLSFGLNEATK